MPRGPKPKVHVSLTSRPYEEHQQMARRLKAPHQEVVRAKILVAAYEHPDWTEYLHRLQAGGFQ